MTAILIRLLVVGAALYLALIILLWTMQAKMIYPAPQDAAPLIPGYEEVSLTTEDGLALRAFYRSASGDLPTLVYFHGNGGSLTGAGVANAALAERGFGVLLVEYRGYGGNPGEPSEEGLYKDGDAAIAWLSALGIPATQTVIVGNSIGGGVATEMAVRHDPAALILVSPFTSLPEAAAANLWWLPAKPLVRDQYRNLDKITQLTMPVLVQHGTRDGLIPHSQGRALAEAAQSAQFQSFDGLGHELSFVRSSGEARADWILASELTALNAEAEPVLP